MARMFFVLGAGSAALAVVFGAFGAHALREHLSPAALAVYETASRYHFYHALALALTVVLARHAPGPPGLRLAGWLFVAGTVVFCGSLYLLAVSGVRWLGAITPIGGVAFIAGWIALAWAAARAG
jgi:uncharacterized membrane protein YgdD (TMEM256/DUF423 family)